MLSAERATKITPNPLADGQNSDKFPGPLHATGVLDRCVLLENAFYLLRGCRIFGVLRKKHGKVAVIGAESALL